MAKMVPVRPDPKVALAVVESLKSVTSGPQEATATLILALRFLNRPPYRKENPTNEELSKEVAFSVANIIEFENGTMAPTSEVVN